MRLRSFLILLLFIILTVAFTWPIPLHMKTALRGHGDPFLNIWILAWDVHQLLNQPLELFEANIFHPYPHTLAYSEHLLASSLIAMPFILIWKNPVLGHNAVFLFSFIFSGWGMYLLVRELTTHIVGTRSGRIHPTLITKGTREVAGIVAGIIFAFCPFRFGHLTHLQLLTIQWLPFTFLYFHRFIRTRTFRDVFLFTAFFLLLGFSCLYYAYYACIALFIAFIFFVRPRHVLKLLLFFIISLTVIFPVTRMYFMVHKEMGFERSLDEAGYYSAKARSYLGVPRRNMLYGKILLRFHRGEKQLFPGIVPLVLAVFSVSTLWKRRGGAPTQVGGSPLHSSNGSVTPVSEPRRIQWFYLTLGIVFFLLSLGPSFPLYKICHSYIPGFSGLRVPARFGIMVVFSLSVLSGFAVLRIKKWRVLFMAVIPLLLILEYWSGPLSFFHVGTKVSGVYGWLAGKDDDTVIVELPMAATIPTVYQEATYVYLSTFHWKKMVNGYSGFFPPSYWDMNKTVQSFPSTSSIDLLRDLGVDYIILHAMKFSRKKRKKIVKEIEDYSDRIVHEVSFDSDHVYRIE